MAGNKVNNTWSKDTPPKMAYLEKAGLTPVKTQKGWCHPITGEVLVAIRDLHNRADVDNADTTGSPDIVSLEWDAGDYTSDTPDILNLTVTFNEDVYMGDATCTFAGAGFEVDQVFYYSAIKTYAANITLGETAADSSTGFVKGYTSAVNNFIMDSTCLAGNDGTGEIAAGDGTFGTITGTVISYNALDGVDGTEDAVLTIPADLNYAANNVLYTFS